VGDTNCSGATDACGNVADEECRYLKIVRLVKSRRTWVGHVARMEEMRNYTTFWAESSKDPRRRWVSVSCPYPRSV
jgi:hypothetical protein